MTTRLPLIALALLGVGLLMLSGCEAAADSSDQAAGFAKQRVYETKSKWNDLLTFKPKNKTPQLPQSRYCYKMQTDIVCYDSPQQNMTASLVGYQDGANVSWFQPGGGSLGVSGGEPTAGFAAPMHPNQAPQTAILSTGQAVPIQGTDCAPGAANNPFYCNESPYVQGAVTSKEITSSPTP